MSFLRQGRTALLLLTGAALPFSPAFAAAPTCKTSGARPLEVGTVAPVNAGSEQNFTINLRSGEGIIADLDGFVTKSSDDSDETPAKRSIKLCNSRGEVLAPLAGEVFEKGGSVSSTADGERLRFVAQSSGQYILSVASDSSPRELLVRQRNTGAMAPPTVAARIGVDQSGVTSSSAPMVFSFNGTAGQWVEIKSTSEKDTVLRLAAPDRAGNYSVIAENDDSDGQNPIIRRKLPSASTYYVQVDSLSSEAGDFRLSIKPIAAPKPPAPPAALRIGSTTSGRLADGDDAKLYSLSVIAGHTYSLELNAAYDGVVAIGLLDPTEPEDGNERSAGFAEVRSQDSGVQGIEKLNFTARTSGQLLVRVKSFGIDSTDGSFTLSATDVSG